MSEKQSLAQLIRDRLNSTAGREMAKTFTAEEPLLQVKNWIPLKPFFKKATGGPGFPAGHLTQIVGKPDSGKTTLMMEGMVATQKSGGVAYLIDSEHKFSLERFAMMGGVPDELVVIQSDTLEQAWDAIEKLLKEIKQLREEGCDSLMMIGWDSIAASVPEKILDSESGDAHMAVEAKLNNKNIRKLRQLIRETDVALVGINHSYQTVPKTPYEMSQTVIKGGEELSFLSTLILRTQQGAKLTRTINKEDQQIGRVTKFFVHKGHLSGRTMNQDVYVVDIGILESKEEYEEYKKSLRGEY